jgi:hypothetical protein
MRKTLIAVLLAAAVAGGGGWYYFYGPCGVRPVAEARLRLKTQAEHWTDALKVAGSTPFIALSGPLGKLQDIKHETSEMRVPPCAEPARDLLSKSMGIAIDGFLAFMSMSPEDRRDAQTPEWAQKSRDEFDFFQIEVTRLEGCAPTCARGTIDWNERRARKESERKDAAAAAAKAADEARKQEAARRDQAAAAEASARAEREREAAAARAAAEAAERAAQDRQDRATVARLLPDLRSAAPSSQFQATNALSAIKLTRDEAAAAVPALIHNLSSDSTVVRGPAAELLGNIGAPLALDALPLLDSLAKNDHSNNVRTQASKAAQKIRLGDAIHAEATKPLDDHK